jgi:hypothetical protein
LTRLLDNRHTDGGIIRPCPLAGATRSLRNWTMNILNVWVEFYGGNIRKDYGGLRLIDCRCSSKVLPDSHPCKVVFRGDRVNKVMSQFLQVNKTTKGERLSKKVKIERTHDEETTKKKILEEAKTTYSWRRIIFTIFSNYVGDDGHPLQNLLQAL